MYKLTVKAVQLAYREYMKDCGCKPQEIIFCGLGLNNNMEGLVAYPLVNSKSINQKLIDDINGNFEHRGEYITFDHGQDPMYTH